MDTLQRLKEAGCCALFWPEDCSDKHEDLDRLFSICDDTLNSWKEAHDTFEQHQGDAKEPATKAHQAFKELCKKALGDEEVSDYGLDAIAYALLLIWVQCRQADLSRIDLKAV